MIEDGRLADLQATLRPLGAPGSTTELRTMVVIPSIDIAPELLVQLEPALPAYEERTLYLLLCLAQPELRIVLVTSAPVAPATIDYYLSLLPDPEHARRRLTALSLGDGAPRPLAAKLLDQPDVITRLREVIGDPHAAFIAPFNVGPPERELALAVGVPLYGPDLRFYGYGTKSGGRELFAEEGVAHPAGAEHIATPEDLVAALIAMRAADPELASVVVKLGDSVYGLGNVVVRLVGLPAPGDPGEDAALHALLQDQLDDDYLRRLAADPGIVEEMVTGEEVISPSVQLRILAGGSDGLLCTQDQLLGGNNGQAFVGCRFPAGEAYAPLIVTEGEKVRRRLAAEGVVGRFGIDFVVVRREVGWSAYAVEINLREGGTSHPFGTLYLLAGGRCDPTGTSYATARGEARCYVATDDLEHPNARGADVGQFLAAAQTAGLRWDPERQTGVVWHMLAALGPLGRVGVTAIGADRADAQGLFDRCGALLHDLGTTSERTRCAQ